MFVLTIVMKSGSETKTLVTEVTRGKALKKKCGILVAYDLTIPRNYASVVDPKMTIPPGSTFSPCLSPVGATILMVFVGLSKLLSSFERTPYPFVFFYG